MVVPSMNRLVTWRVRYSEKRRTLSTCYTGISFCMCRHPRGEWIGCLTCLETKWGLASLYRCIVVCQMSSQSSRREWAQTRLSLGITNDPWLWLYMISRGYSVLCVKTILYFLMFMKLPVKVIHCIIAHCGVDGECRNWIYFNSCRTLSNCLQIVILYRLYAWLWHICDFDTNFRLYIIPFMAIPCIGIFTVRIPPKKTYSK
jgi:hypothetical protein